MSTLTKKVDIGLKILLIWAVLAPLIYTWYFLGARLTPWWSDPGEWLKYANAVEAWFARCLGINSPHYEAMLYTMWDQGVFQYPPLFFLILILLKYALGPLQALKVAGSVLFALQPLPIYFLAKKITNSGLSGLVAAYAMSFMPIYIEMLGWGGYPNLLGLLLIPINIVFTISVMSNPQSKNICLMVLTSVLIPFSHHLTSGVFLGILLFWMLFLAIMRKSSKVKYVMYDVAASLVALTCYRMLLAYPSQLIIFNEAAYYSLRVNFLEAMFWALKVPAMIVVTSLIISFVVLKRNEIIQKEYQALLLAWVLFPVIATQSYIFGVAIDFNRIFFFIFQAAPIAIALPFSLIKNIYNTGERVFGNPLGWHLLKRLLLTVFIVSLSVMASILIFLTGMDVVANVSGWYSSQDIYGDYEKISALDWIKRETPLNSTFVADEYIGRWIEGYASRRTYIYIEPRFIFIKGQMERYYIASFILLAEREIRNCYLRILDQAPYSMSYTPIICFWNKGEYKEALYINESMVMDKFENLSSIRLSIVPIICAEKNSIETHYVSKSISPQNEEPLIKKVTAVDNQVVNITYIYEKMTGNITVDVVPSPKRSVSLVEISGQRVTLHADIGKIFIETSAEKIENEGRKIRLYDEDGILNIQVFMENPMKNELSQTLILESSKIMRENKISYIVVPRTTLKELRSLPEYQHLLNKFKAIYINDRVIILEANKDIDQV
ncbi:MAG: hypothetical protein QXF59_04770 [Candidatus Bathyarchaeia archaeon]